MNCVVCGVPLSATGIHYANAWEASLRQHPCCSPACGQQFDPNLHWMPAAAPAALADELAREPIEHAKRRLRDGDDSGLVARDLLSAGVAPWMVRRALLSGAMTAVTSDRLTGSWNSFFGHLLGRSLLIGDPKRGVADPGAVLDGNATVDAWEQRFGTRMSTKPERR